MFPHWVPTEKKEKEVNARTAKTLGHKYKPFKNKTFQVIKLLNKFKLTVHQCLSYLVEFELKTEDVAEGERLTHVRLDEREEELILVRSTLIHLQDDVQNPVWIQVETACVQFSITITDQTKIKHAHVHTQTHRHAQKQYNI